MPAWWTEVIPTVALLISAFALIFNGYNVRSSAKTKDLEWVFRYLSDMRAMEAKLLADAPPEERQTAFVEFINHLETCCYAHNEALYPKRTRAMVTDNLVNAIASIQCSPYANGLDRLLTGPMTLDSLETFIYRHRSKITATVTATRAAEKVALPPSAKS